MGGARTSTQALFLLSDLEIKIVVVITVVNPVDNDKKSMVEEQNLRV